MTSTTNLATLGTRTRAARRIAAVCGTGVLLLGAGACGSSDPDPAVQGSGTSADAGPATDQQGPQGQRPGANGKIAAVADKTAQVQSAGSGQVAVTWTSATTFTKQVAASLADVEVGDCVMVTSESSDAAATEVAATAVRISEPVDDSCAPTGGPGGGGGPQLRGNAPRDNVEGGQAPQGVPSGAPPGGQLRAVGGAFGTVTSASAQGFVVESTIPARGETEAETRTVTVTVAASTTYATTATGSASDVKVGQCLRADGEADDTGAVTATKIALTPPTDGECGGMVRFAGGGPGSTGGQAS